MIECSKKAIIIYQRYYDFKNNRILSGGVQTYITNIIPLIMEAGYKCTVFQFEAQNKSEEITLDKCIVKSVPNSEIEGICKSEVILDYISDFVDKKNDLLIFADHILTVKNDVKHSISIQHGVHWDIKKDVSRKNMRMFLSKARFAYNEHRKMKFVKEVICVDYNFLNWYRAQVDVPNSNFTVIPNFTKIAKEVKKPDGNIKIIFARRFVKHRGTRVFAEAVNKLLQEYSNIEVTIAGRGPDEEYLHEQFDKWKDRVSFIQYHSNQSLEIHSDKHIAVVPTVGSEGTSLSLLEAMSAQCAVVCTDVGGMTNIVLDGYNGRMVRAGDVDQLYSAIKELIDNSEERKRIAKCGYDTVKNTFSYEKWSNRWRNVLQKINEG